MPTHTLEQFRATRIDGEKALEIIEAIFGQGFVDSDEETFFVYCDRYYLSQNAGRFCVDAWGAWRSFSRIEQAEEFLYNEALAQGEFETAEEKLRAVYRNSEYAGVAA